MHGYLRNGSDLYPRRSLSDTVQKTQLPARTKPLTNLRSVFGTSEYKIWKNERKCFDKFKTTLFWFASLADKFSVKLMCWPLVLV